MIKKRSEALIASCDSELKIWSGKTDSWWLSCGECFSLDKQDYRITSLYLNAVNNDNEHAGLCYCDLCASDNKSSLNFSREFKTPIIPGVLLARVVGPDSEEYYTDDNGRVKSAFSGEKSQRQVQIKPPVGSVYLRYGPGRDSVVSLFLALAVRFWLVLYRVILTIQLSLVQCIMVRIHRLFLFLRIIVSLDLSPVVLRMVKKEKVINWF